MIKKEPRNDELAKEGKALETVERVYVQAQEMFEWKEEDEAFRRKREACLSVVLVLIRSFVSVQTRVESLGYFCLRRQRHRSLSLRISASYLSTNSPEKEKETEVLEECKDNQHRD